MHDLYYLWLLRQHKGCAWVGLRRIPRSVRRFGGWGPKQQCNHSHCLGLQPVPEMRARSFAGHQEHTCTDKGPSAYKQPSSEKNNQAAPLHCVKFPVACSRSNKTFCFRLSWAGHHAVRDPDHENFAPRITYPKMLNAVGFPVASSLMVSVQAHINSGGARDLGKLFVQQFQAINRRYSDPKTPLQNNDGRPHHNLAPLERAIRDETIMPRLDRIQKCLLYTRSKEWFTTTECAVSLPPGGEEGKKMAEDVVEFVCRGVMKWHAKNHRAPKKEYSTSYGAWRPRLWTLLSNHRNMFSCFTLEDTNSVIRVRKFVDIPDEDDSCDEGCFVYDWVMTCGALEDIVKDVDRSIRDSNEGETIWEFTGETRGPPEVLLEE